MKAATGVDKAVALGSGLIAQSQKSTVAASAMVEKKTFGGVVTLFVA